MCMTYLPTVYRQTAREVRIVLVVGLMNGFWYIYVYVLPAVILGNSRAFVLNLLIQLTEKKKS